MLSLALNPFSFFWPPVFEVLLPCCVPTELQEQNVGVAMEIKVLEDLLPAAVRKGTFLTVPAIRAILRGVHAEVPKHPHGSGKGGNIMKVDLANALVRHLYPMNPESDILRMVNAILGRKRKVSPAVLQIVANLDPENQEDSIFKKMSKEASEQLQKSFEEEGAEKQKRRAAAKQKEDQDKQEAPRKPPELHKHEEAKARVHAEHKAREKETTERLMNLTPPDLKQFLPGGGEIKDTFWIDYHPIAKKFRVKYPRVFAGRAFGFQRAPFAYPTRPFFFELHLRRGGSYNGTVLHEKLAHNTLR